MSSPLRLWLCAAHHKAFLNGGWAFVRAAGAERSGVAGGDRRTNRLAMLVAGLVDALKDQPLGDAVLHLAAADAVLLAPLAGGEPPKDVDPAAYAPAVAALKGRPLRLVKLADPAGTPLAFAQAWADLASDKAKATGAFRSAIPKPNLAKVAGL
ncbi:ribonuclease H [Phenylobacterium sp. J367]|uniref:ribonuclease H n=1 Tax=Phenylobacterium sp. J367 TaxID=2898435 RepID=UPI002150AA9F|nr:ribonuclease H [Phenylobacterium sp. J367]MCR5877388.1 ribonuclease H [Phenylobacterium sp. J367]